jgi:chromosomal replication initiation ATPase DnaA
MSKSDRGGGLSSFCRSRIIQEALIAVAQRCGVSKYALAEAKRSADIAFARQLAMYLCHVVADMSLREVAQAFNRDRTTVSHACHLIEDRRECPVFDQLVESIENELRGRIRMVIEDAIARGAPERKYARLSA